MYKLAKGWTKKKVMEQIKKYNNGKPSYGNDNFHCLYKSPNGNRCLIGCFIPGDHKGLKYNRGIVELLRKYPDLKKEMPFDNIDALLDFQQIHDETVFLCRPKKTVVYDKAKKFLDEEVE